MKTRFLKFLKHAALTLVFLLMTAMGVGLSIGARANYGEHPQRLNWHNEGPYVFFEKDGTYAVEYVQGDKEKGFYTRRNVYHTGDAPQVRCYNPFDSSHFDFQIMTQFETPKSVYEDQQPIFAVSDIEGNYMAFRNFLIKNKIINEALEWTFDQGHLVLVGDFVDRGFFVTQVLWLIFKLEHEAKLVGGTVHFIIGNHELKNLQANFESSSPKYYFVSTILGKKQHELYDDNALIGRWLSSKNAIEKINGYLFAHGGLHPEIAQYSLDLEEVNHIIRRNYRKAYFPKPHGGLEKLLTSGRTGPCWYRGYFNDDLSEEEVVSGLKLFDAKAIVVGHTIQSKVKLSFGGKVIGIDVRHPSDDEKNWPKGHSEGLLIQDNLHYRVLEDGRRKLLY